MRGFNLDHGTDLAFFVDGVPINAVSHAHGQGYSDLHFIIPETIGTLESTKGPYSARVGDFATAGSVTFHMADHVPDSYAKLEVGPYAHDAASRLRPPTSGSAGTCSPLPKPSTTTGRSSTQRTSIASTVTRR